MSEKEHELMVKAIIGHMYLVGGIVAPTFLSAIFLLAMSLYYFYFV